MRDALDFLADEETASDINKLLRMRIALLGERLMATFTDEQLQKLWASFDGLETDIYAVSGDMVLAEFARRSATPR